MSAIQPCQRETIHLAVAGRPDWDAQQVEYAVIRSYQTGATPARILMEVVRLMAMAAGESEPRDLDVALARPSGWRSPASGLAKPGRKRRSARRG